MGRNSEVALGVALVSTLFNQFYLEPQSTDIMFKRYKLEDVSSSRQTTPQPCLLRHHTPVAAGMWCSQWTD